MTVIDAARVKEIVLDVLKDFGNVIFVASNEVPPNNINGVWIENLIDVTTDNAGENFEEIFRTKFSEKLEAYRAATINDDPYQNPVLKTNNPIFTYRDPAILEVPQARRLISISIGYPFVVQPHLPRKDL